MDEQETGLGEPVLRRRRRIVRPSDGFQPVELRLLQRGAEALALEAIELVIGEQAVDVDVAEAEDALEGGDAGRLQRVLARVVDGRRREEASARGVVCDVSPVVGDATCRTARECG